ncbi:hypothetical protein ACLOJK_022349, partial [Asimina triloba]
ARAEAQIDDYAVVEAGEVVEALDMPPFQDPYGGDATMTQEERWAVAAVGERTKVSE